MNLQLFYLYNGKNCIKWQGILKPLWQSKQGSLFLTSLYCWTCTVLMHLSSSKVLNKTKRPHSLKFWLRTAVATIVCLMQWHCEVQGQMSEDIKANSLWKGKGLIACIFSVLYWTQTLNPNAFTSQANANSNFEAHVSSQVPLLLLKHRKQAWCSKRGFALSHEIISMFRLCPRSPRALAQTLQTLLVNSHVAWGLNDKQ